MPLVFSPRRGPQHSPVSLTSRRGPVQDAWVRHSRPTAQPGDREHTLEEAYRWQAVLDLVPDGELWVLQADYETAMSFDDPAEIRHIRELGRPVVYGMLPRLITHGVRIPGAPRPTLSTLPEIEDDLDVARYLTWPAWPSISHRSTTLCGLMDPTVGDTGRDVRDVVAEMASAGADAVAIKHLTAKRGIARLDLAGVAPDRGSTEKALWSGGDVLESLLMAADGREVLAVSPWVPMRYEYRLFVADGQVVTGAGCVEEHTPADRRGTAFDAQVRQWRDRRSPVEHRPDIRDQLVAFGREVAAEVVREAWVRRFVLDVALDEDDQPVVVEVNGLLNSGLFASAPHAVVRALLAQ